MSDWTLSVELAENVGKYMANLTVQAEEHQTYWNMGVTAFHADPKTALANACVAFCDRYPHDIPPITMHDIADLARAARANGQARMRDGESRPKLEVV